MSPLQDAVLHCLKYSGQDVYGLFLSKSEKIEKCVPLFHTPCITVPSLRTCMSILDEIEGMRVVGIYYATNASEEITPVVKWLHDQISKAFPDRRITILKYQNELITGMGLSDFPFGQYKIQGASLKKDSEFYTSLDREALKKAISDEDYLANLVDFEDFLGNPHLEWIR